MSNRVRVVNDTVYSGAVVISRRGTALTTPFIDRLKIEWVVVEWDIGGIEAVPTRMLKMAGGQ
jgi:hypothetical protein